MPHTTPLPAYLVRRYQGWKATAFSENEAWYKTLAKEGQHPRAMLISCCDSRVHGTVMFSAEAGEFFVHRNIANLVPPYAPDGDHHGTSAAVEYAVTALKVAHVIVLGHSGCGGVAGCIKMCDGEAPELEQQTSFVGRWLDILRTSCEGTSDISDAAERQVAMERRGVVVSLDNLMTFPFIAERVKEGTLSLHGLRTDIATGGLETWDSAAKNFVQV